MFDNYTQNTLFEGAHYKLELWDCAGQADYDRLRPLSYPQTDVFLMCFSIIEPTSFDNISKKWIPEIRHHCPEGTKIVLVGTKADLKNDAHILDLLEENGKEPISAKQCKKLCKDYGLDGYVECSAATQQGVDQVFDTAIKVLVQQPEDGAGASGGAGSAGSATAATGTSNRFRDKYRNSSATSTGTTRVKKKGRCVVF